MVVPGDGRDNVRVPGQRRLAFKSASRAHCPDADCLIIAPGDQLGAVVVPGDGRDEPRVPAQPALAAARYGIHRSVRRKGHGLDTITA